MNKINRPWLILNAIAGCAALALTVTGCDTSRNDRDTTVHPADTSESRTTDTRTTDTSANMGSANTTTTNSQQPGSAPSPTSVYNSGDSSMNRDNSMNRGTTDSTNSDSTVNH